MRSFVQFFMCAMATFALIECVPLYRQRSFWDGFDQIYHGSEDYDDEGASNVDFGARQQIQRRGRGWQGASAVHQDNDDHDDSMYQGTGRYEVGGKYSRNSYKNLGYQGGRYQSRGRNEVGDQDDDGYQENNEYQGHNDDNAGNSYDNFVDSVRDRRRHNWDLRGGRGTYQQGNEYQNGEEQQNSHEQQEGNDQKDDQQNDREQQEGNDQKGYGTHQGGKQDSNGGNWHQNGYNNRGRGGYQSRGRGVDSYPQDYDKENNDYGEYQPKPCRGCRVNNIGNGRGNVNRVYMA